MKNLNLYDVCYEIIEEDSGEVIAYGKQLSLPKILRKPNGLLKQR
jgi:hypothetical protein